MCTESHKMCTKCSRTRWEGGGGVGVDQQSDNSYYANLALNL